jgi:nucleoside-diphosphate-sugar epimerase
MTILVTGANGFIGLNLVKVLTQQKLPFRACLRSPHNMLEQGLSQCIVGDIGPNTDWTMTLYGVTSVIHTAARQHVMRNTQQNMLDVFRQVNVLGSVNLARQAAAAGVRRFVFVSSIKVNGEFTEPGRVFTADDVPAPEDPYGVTKLETEKALLALGKETGLEVVIVRPPLVYGPKVKGNFASLMRAVNKGIPLPFGYIDSNRRSMVTVDNLASLLITCLTHPKAKNEVFLVCDGEDLSTAELLRRLGMALGKPARLLPVPTVLLRLGATALGRQDLACRLFRNLQVDDRKTRILLNWMPVQNVADGLKAAVNALA